MSKLTFILILFYLSFCNAQTAFEKAQLKANAFYDKNYFQQAISYYKKCIRLDQNHVPSMIFLALCYKKLNQQKQALLVFDYLYKKNLLHDTLMDPYIDCVKKTGKLEKLQVLKDSKNLSDSIRTKLVTEYDSILKWNHKPLKMLLKNLKDINTPFSELAPVIYGKEGLVYLSNKEGLFIKKREESTGMPNYNIYLSRFTKQDSLKFEQRKLFSNEVNSMRQEGGICFSSKLDQVYYSRAFRDYDKTYRFKLYLSQKKKKTWSNLMEFAFNDSTASFTHPNLSPDGNFFFFSSDMEGGYGGRDIYVCVKVDSLWSEPLNVGPVVNSNKDEIFPFFSTQGTLYFSSNGHTSIGGYDLFKAIQVEGEWLRVENLKSPINTCHDEFSINLSDASEKKGYFSSNRPGGEGLEDLYYFELK